MNYREMAKHWLATTIEIDQTDPPILLRLDALRWTVCQIFRFEILRKNGD